ncbi:hypothetical protein, partial [Vibrio cholerae]|uniref:hypothetical protein n=1 Tax=Vibrio cholerae TaxID=666 RepID=UPI0039C8C17C
PNVHEAASFSYQKPHFILAAIIFFTLCLFFLKNKSNDNYAYHKIAKIDNCNVYVLGQTYQKNDVLSKVSAVLKREDID